MHKNGAKHEEDSNEEDNDHKGQGKTRNDACGNKAHNDKEEKVGVYGIFDLFSGHNPTGVLYGKNREEHHVSFGA